MKRIFTSRFGAFPTHPAQALAVMLNTLTTQQIWAAQRLALHAGKTVRICVGSFNLDWTIGSEGQLSQALEETKPDVTLDIQVEKLNPLVWLTSSQRPDLAEYVHVSGQAALAQVMSELARDLRPDPEDALSQWLGDIPARRVVRSAQQMGVAARTFGTSLAHNLAEYLSEETDALVGQPAMTSQRARQSALLGSLAQLERTQLSLLARLNKLERTKGLSK